MSPQSKTEYLEAIVKRYKMATKAQKSLILDEFCAATQYHRKHAIRLLRGFKRFTKPHPKPRGPKPVYDSPELLKALKKIWLAANLALLPPVESLVAFMAPQLRSHLRRTVPSGSKRPTGHFRLHHRSAVETRPHPV